MLHASEPSLLCETAGRANTVRHALGRFLAMAVMEVIMEKTVDSLLPVTLDNADSDREGADRSPRCREGADRTNRHAFLFRRGILDD